MKAFVDIKNLIYNIEKISKITGFESVCMVKCNAYGHGLIEVSKALECAGVSKFGIAKIAEGLELRKSGIQGQILLMAGFGIQSCVDELFEYQITPIISSLDELEALKVKQKPLSIHLSIDTGMCREGFLPKDLPKLIKWWQEQTHCLNLEGLSTHFANAEQANCSFTREQLRIFDEVLAQLQQVGMRPQVIHTSNSNGILNGFAQSYPSYETWVRPGLALYGLMPGFKPVMNLKTHVTLIKEVEPGSKVGYGGTFIAKRATRLALIRTGYGDGYKRGLSNRAYVLAQGNRFPVVGNISMDSTVIDITGSDLKLGDEVVLLGTSGDLTVSSHDLAGLLDTIPYEIVSQIAARVPRIYS